jgi:hypothetical protein
MMKLPFHSLCFIVFPPLPIPMFVLDLPRRLAAMANALLGMLIVDLLLLLSSDSEVLVLQFMLSCPPSP